MSGWGGVGAAVPSSWKGVQSSRLESKPMSVDFLQRDGSHEIISTVGATCSAYVFPSKKLHQNNCK